MANHGACTVCGVRVHKKAKRGPFPKYCDDCRKVVARERQREYDKRRGNFRPAVVKCPQCGADFDRQGLRKKYCSDACRVIACRPPREVATAYARRKAAEQRAARGTPIDYHDCVICGSTFVVNMLTPDRLRTVCSNACRNQRNKLSPGWQESRQKAKDRRRARLADAYVEDVDRQAIYERDDWNCQLCQRKVDRNAKCPDDLAPTLDHVVPLARGGTHEASNVQLAHFICNSRKTHRGGGDQLRLIG